MWHLDRGVRGNLIKRDLRETFRWFIHVCVVVVVKSSFKRLHFLQDFEDVLFSKSDMDNAPVLMAIKIEPDRSASFTFSSERPTQLLGNLSERLMCRVVGVAAVDTINFTMMMEQFIDDEQLSTVEALMLHYGCRECIVPLPLFFCWCIFSRSLFAWLLGSGKYSQFLPVGFSLAWTLEILYFLFAFNSGSGLGQVQKATAADHTQKQLASLFERINVLVTERPKFVTNSKLNDYNLSQSSPL